MSNNPSHVKIKFLHDDAALPKYQSDGAGCFDLHSVEEDVRVLPKMSAVIRTGLAFQIPPSFVMEIYSRSGHGFNNGIRLANCVGIIDADYRGEVMVKLTNDSQKTFIVNKGDRIAQAKLVWSPRVQFEEVDELDSTERGAGGFGSTGA